MLNRIWFWLLLIGILYGFGKGAWKSTSLARNLRSETSRTVESHAESGSADAPPALVPTSGPISQSWDPLKEQGKLLTDAALDAAKTAVDLCIVLIAVMTLWLGLLNVARDAGLVDGLARAMRPLMCWLFPDVPSDHPAMGAMLMNMSANLLGLGNAATPFGLQAMRELQTLNPHKETATNAMAMFLAINTSNVTLVPITIIGLRAGAGSADPAQPLAGIVVATLFSTVVAVVAVKYLARWSRYSVDHFAAVAVNGMRDTEGETSHGRRDSEAADRGSK